MSFLHGELLASIFTNDAGVIERAAEYLRGFAPEAIITCILFSLMGYFNGHSKSLFVMFQGLAQSFLVRLPMSYIMSIQPDASLTHIGWAAPTATAFGIVLCLIYYQRLQRELKNGKV
jgi:Na+-driven multidrug efflux pump